mgnify:CR=1 FL=1
MGNKISKAKKALKNFYTKKIQKVRKKKNHPQIKNGVIISIL